ncbi:hypothetical protein UK23_42945 [Lentzea aerocolonigenes]|uniref:EBNA-1 nuclear protein n=1 Tax=Lentzea aerocolonigenes TaxID=68170 RepID=A0A0F0GD62_LENAE|nr:DUF1611 domain-containing protein [Lentzea aerocolonigenes]KJK35273.1 hypothetical protein UK23_42945 [Lentzea aerocolonigenes]
MEHLKRLAVLADGEMAPHPSKTLAGVLRYRSDRVVVAVDRQHDGRDTGDVLGLGHGTPIVRDVAAALEHGPDGVLLATEPTGGVLHPYWRDQILQAAEAGLDVVNGLHTLISGDERIVAAAQRSGARIWDLRTPPVERYRTPLDADGKPIVRVREHRPGTRTVLAVGTDCGIGKMTTMLEIERESAARGLGPAFVATGQIAMMITGRGVPVDAIMSDFVNSVVEDEVCDAVREHDLVLVEGQGALNHPRFSAVTLGLLHGTRPDSMILCHDLRRPAIKLMPDWPLPPLKRAIEINEEAARWLWPDGPARVVGVSVITGAVPDEQARAELARITEETGLPATDVLRYGPGPLVDAIMAGPVAS